MNRKIIQIAVDHKGATLALCNDGTLWRTYNPEQDAWARMKDVPQPEVSAEAKAIINAAITQPIAMSPEAKEKVEEAERKALRGNRK